MLSYSVAIRTLGTSGDMLRRELESIKMQTVKPDKVLIYIARGYTRPGFTIGDEIYIPVEKGMAAQRLLPYTEIDSDVIFFLDDDVELAPDAAEKMLRAMEINQADCLGADTFENHKMSVAAKFRSAMTNLVFPHFGKKWAFKIHPNGSFSYIRNPEPKFYLSQSCAGPALMMRKKVYDRLDYASELWLDPQLSGYGEDFIETYKAHRNGYKLGVLFDAGCRHLDGKTSGEGLREGPDKVTRRTAGIYITWHRAVYSPAASGGKFRAASAMSLKLAWLFAMHCALAAVRFTPGYVSGFLRGVKKGRRFVRSEEYKNLPPYVAEKA